MFNPKTIYIDKNIYTNKLWQNKLEQILLKYPGTVKKEVNSHWNIKEISKFTDLIKSSLPYCEIRYAF